MATLTRPAFDRSHVTETLGLAHAIPHRKRDDALVLIFLPFVLPVVLAIR